MNRRNFIDHVIRRKGDKKVLVPSLGNEAMTNF
jgi:hypothetical protein